MRAREVAAPEVPRWRLSRRGRGGRRRRKTARPGTRAARASCPPLPSSCVKACPDLSSSLLRSFSARPSPQSSTQDFTPRSFLTTSATALLPPQQPNQLLLLPINFLAQFLAPRQERSFYLHKHVSVPNEAQPPNRDPRALRIGLRDPIERYAGAGVDLEVGSTRGGGQGSKVAVLNERELGKWLDVLEVRTRREGAVDFAEIGRAHV